MVSQYFHERYVVTLNFVIILDYIFVIITVFMAECLFCHSYCSRYKKHCLHYEWNNAMPYVHVRQNVCLNCDAETDDELRARIINSFFNYLWKYFVLKAVYVYQQVCFCTFCFASQRRRID